MKFLRNWGIPILAAIVWVIVVIWMLNDLTAYQPPSRP